MNRAQSGRRSRDSASQRVIERIAEAEGISPVELTPPLYEIVDPDALDRLFRSTATAGRMEGRAVFTYNGYEVSVYGDGHVSVEARGVESGERDLS